MDRKYCRASSSALNNLAVASASVVWVLEEAGAGAASFSVLFLLSSLPPEEVEEKRTTSEVSRWPRMVTEVRLLLLLQVVVFADGDGSKC